MLADYSRQVRRGVVQAAARMYHWRDGYAIIEPRHRIYIRDAYDHLVRLFDINESMRDQVGGRWTHTCW